MISTTCSKSKGQKSSSNRSPTKNTELENSYYYQNQQKDTTFRMERKKGSLLKNYFALPKSSIFSHKKSLPILEKGALTVEVQSQVVPFCHKENKHNYTPPSNLVSYSDFFSNKTHIRGNQVPANKSFPLTQQ